MRSKRRLVYLEKSCYLKSVVFEIVKKNNSDFHQIHLMVSRTSSLFLVEKLSKFDADLAPPRNPQMSKKLIFRYTVDTLDPLISRKRDPSEGRLGGHLGGFFGTKKGRGPVATRKNDMCAKI